MDRLGRTAEFAWSHKLFSTFAVGTVAAGSFAGIKYPDEIVAATKAVFNYVFTDYDLPPESSDATVGTTSYVCFVENPNCDNTSAAQGKVGPLASIYSGGNSIPLNVEPGTYTNLVNALVDGEDERALTRDGFDYEAFLRAFIVNVKTRSVRQGFSTLSDMLVSNLYPQSTPAGIKRANCGKELAEKPDVEKTPLELTEPQKAIDKCAALTEAEQIEEKSYEVGVAKTLDAKYSTDKDPVTGEYLGRYEIIEDLINTANLGEGMRGFGAAAIHDFGVTADKLSILQAATLVAKIQSPNNYDGDKDPVKNAAERSKLFFRRNEILDANTRNGHLDPAERDRLQKIQLDDPESGMLPFRMYPQGISIDYEVANRIGARMALTMILDQVKASGLGGEFLARDLRINTTFSYPRQEAVRVAAEEADYPRDGRQLAIVVENQDGAVEALYGGNFQQSQVNLATTPVVNGSGDKPHGYAALFESGVTLDTARQDPPVFVWEGGNGDGTDYVVESGNYCASDESCTVREAIRESSNMVPLQLFKELGQPALDRMDQIMKGLYIPSDTPAAPGYITGGRAATLLDRVTGFNGLVGNRGMSMPYRLINDIAAFENGAYPQKIDYRLEIPKTKPSVQVVAPEIADMVIEGLRGVVDPNMGGTAAANLGDIKALTDLGCKTATHDSNKMAGIICTVALPDGNKTVGVLYRRTDSLLPMEDGTTGGKLPARVAGVVIRPLVGESRLING